MNKKKLIGSILLLGVVVVYCGLYVAVTNILTPLELDFAKSGIDAFSEPVIDENEIKKMESQAVLMENSPSIKNIPQSQRVRDAKQMRNNNSSKIPEIIQGNSDFKKFSYYSMWAYYLIFRWDIANEISDISKDMDSMYTLNNGIDDITEKMAVSWENGDNKAYATDLRDLVNSLRQLSCLNIELKDHFQNLVQKMEKK
ncbi:MAG: hypothetical protein PHY59_06385 [Methanobacterium sp.]|nr:hypothetical protein [Methanobacterium sp.]